jgi:hypothetical protein
MTKRENFNLRTSRQASSSCRDRTGERFLASLEIAVWAITVGLIGICIVLIVRTIPSIDLAPRTTQHINLAR